MFNSKVTTYFFPKNSDALLWEGLSLTKVAEMTDNDAPPQHSCPSGSQVNLSCTPWSNEFGKRNGPRTDGNGM